jgi:hypothetical protein
MKVAITHLTRMQRGYVCVAGVNVEDGQPIRPVAPRGRLQDTVCARRGGPFDMAVVVDLGPTRAVGEPPEIEDHEFTTWHAHVTQAIEPDLFWEMLGVLARPTVRELFGPALRPIGNSRAATDVGAGNASLGVIKPRGRPQLYLDERPGRLPAPRLRFGDGDLRLDLSVTDLRLSRADHVTPATNFLAAAQRRLQRGVPMLLSVGLTRPSAARQGEPPRHWLQVNNLHFEDAPTWRLVSGPSTPHAVGVAIGADPLHDPAARRVPSLTR